MLDYSTYINTSQDNFIATLVSETNSALFNHAIANTCSFNTPVPPTISLAQQLETVARNQINTSCYESCAVEANIGTGDMQTCNALTTLNSLYRKTPIHTVDFTCTAAN